MAVSRYLFKALALSFIAAYPYKAFSHEIPFYVTYPKEDKTPDLVIACSGPYLRNSGSNIINPGTEKFKFYSAEVTKYSPYGKWACSTYEISRNGTDISGQKAEVKFHLTKDDEEVSLAMTKYTLSVDLSDDSDTISIYASPRDNHNNNEPDSDTFSIQGTEGDTVTVTLSKKTPEQDILERKVL